MKGEEVKTRKILKLMHNEGLSYLEAEQKVDLEEHEAWVEEMLNENSSLNDNSYESSQEAWVEGNLDYLDSISTK